MQLINLALYSAALLATAQAAPSPMRLDFSLRRESPATVFSEACLMVCLPEKTECGGKSYPKKFGECWTCCVKYGEDSIAPKENPVPATTSHAIQKEDVSITIDVKEGNESVDDICLKVCWPRVPQCPNGWYSNNKGNENRPCWTCCKAPYEFDSESALLAEVSRQQEEM